MITIYKNNSTGKIEKTNEFEKGSWINMINPTEKEIQYVCENVKIEDQFIKYALDYEETARIDIEDDSTLFMIDVPTVEKTKDGEMFSTIPLGMIVVRDEFFITVCLNETQIIKDFEKSKMKNFYTHKKTRFILQILFKNAAYFLNYLKLINKETEIAELALQKSMKNKELIKLLTLEKSLVYFSTSLKANEAVMEKTLKGRVIKLYEEDEDILEDAIVENKQAIEMSKIYRDILSGTMDAYASIISNNLNIVMKFLAAITIVLSLPTMVSSFFGMNVHIPLQANELAFGIIIVISILISILAAWWLKRKDMF